MISKNFPVAEKCPFIPDDQGKTDPPADFKKRYKRKGRAIKKPCLSYLNTT